MHVYVVESQSGLVKIGRTRNPTQRLKSIQMHGGFHPVRVWFSMPVLRHINIETAAHKRMAHSRKIGEWFDCDFDDAVKCVCDCVDLCTPTVKTKSDLPAFASRLIFFRKSAGLTQAQLAAKSGVTQQTISYLESGNATQKVLHIVMLAKALKIPAEALAEGMPDSSVQEATTILSTLTPSQRAQAVRMLEAFAASCRAAN